MIDQLINQLVCYGLATGLIEKEDKIYITNRLLELFEIEDYHDTGVHEQDTGSADDASKAGHGIDALSLEEILDRLLDYACENGILKDNSIVARDLFDTKIMALLTPRPSQVMQKFRELYQQSPRIATDYFYQLCGDSNYIRTSRVKKDMKWITPTEYGDIDITINLSKPEKDPRIIAQAKLMKQSGYPKCLLCKENVGFAGDLNRPARQNLRMIPIQLNHQRWEFQYSPYVYYNEHCIVLKDEHIPMQISRSTFTALLDFVRQFPHYFIGSNADLPIVGGSILTHEHYQGGRYEFAMATAPTEKYFTFKGFPDIEAGIVKWPMSVIRLKSTDSRQLTELADRILKEWRIYSDETVDIFASTSGEIHNTITPIARFKDGKYELDLVLRNNRTSDAHPLGIFHPHAELHHIKKENIGLIEVMGLAVLPSRLKEEMELLKDYIMCGKDIRSNPTIEKHADWVEAFLPRYANISCDNIDGILQKEIGRVFLRVLEDAGVYKRTRQGQEAFLRFIHSII